MLLFERRWGVGFRSTLDPSLLLFDPRNRTGDGRKIGEGVVHPVSFSLSPQTGRAPG